MPKEPTEDDGKGLLFGIILTLVLAVGAGVILKTDGDPVQPISRVVDYDKRPKPTPHPNQSKTYRNGSSEPYYTRDKPPRQSQTTQTYPDSLGPSMHDFVVDTMNNYVDECDNGGCSQAEIEERLRLHNEIITRSEEIDKW